MKFGNPETFAVEAIVQPIGRHIGFGQIRVLVGDLELGDFSIEHCSLHHPIEDLERLVNEAPLQWDVTFEGLTEIQIYELLNNALFMDAGQSEEQVATDSCRYRRFSLLTNSSEHFDGFKVFAYCKSSIIYFVARLPNDDIKAASCAFAPLVRTISELRAWFDGACTQQSVQDGAVKPCIS